MPGVEVTRRWPVLPFGLALLDVLAALALGPFVLLDVAIAIQSGLFGLLTTAVSVLAAAAVLVRRRWALAGALVVCGASITVTVMAGPAGQPMSPEAVAPLALAYLLIPLVRRAPAPVAIGLSILAFVAMTLTASVRGFEQGPPVVHAMLLWIVLGTGAGIGVYQRWTDLTHQQAVEAARQAERLDLARELHDVVAHHVSGMVVQAQAALLVSGERPDAAVDALRAIEGAGAEALVSMRAMVGSLRTGGDAPSTPASSVADIAELVAQAQRAGHPVVWTLDLPPGTVLPDAVSGATYRIVREALSNVRRHAGPTASVAVSVTGSADAVEVSIVDDGAVPRSAWPGAGGFGIVGMTERVVALGGSLHAGPADASRGWQVRAHLPLEPRRLA